jgi:hypothetical protein
VWQRNILFLGVSFAGVAALAYSLLPTNRVPEPTSFDPNRAQRDGFGQVVDQVDVEFEDHWELSDLAPAERADDLVIARRLSLGLMGTVPSFEEIRRFEEKPEAERIEWWLSRILEDRRFADYLAERLARSFVGTEGGPFIRYRRDRLVRWLSDRLDEKAAYNQIVKELLADSGLWTSSPAVNFVSVTLNDNEGGQPDPVKLAARTTRAFLGMRIDCLQCHDNNLPDEFVLGSGGKMHDGTQQDFHQLAAFFSEAEVTLRGVQDDSENIYEFEYLYSDKTQEVPPVFPFYDDLHIEGETRREQLANWVTHPDNKAFSRSIVNRVWALMIGKPLTDQVDNIPLYGYGLDSESISMRAGALVFGDPISLPVEDLPAIRHLKGETKYRWWNGASPFPPGLETLADDFVQHGYDLRRLIRLIAATKVFQQRGPFDAVSTQRTRDGLAVFPTTRLRPEQVAGAIIQSTSLATIDERASIVSKLARYFQEKEFVNRYGDPGEDEFSERGGTIPQRLEMMNGGMAHERIKFQGLLLNAASAISQLAPDDKTAIESVYLAAWSRRPPPAHLEFFEKELKGKKGQQRAKVIQDLYWVLFNARRFAWNH